MQEHDKDRPVVGVGLVNKDFVASVPSWERDAKVSASAYLEQVGGPVPVALAALARLGTDTPISLLGVIGDDHDGAEITHWLGTDRIDTGFLTRAAGVRTSRSLVLLDERDGTRTVANYASHLPVLTFTPQQEALLARSRLVHLDGRDLDASLRAAEITRAGGGTVSLDLGTMRPGCERLLPLCHIILASRKGAQGAFPDIKSPDEQAHRFCALGAKIAGVTLAGDGVVVATPGKEPRHLRAFAVSPVRDTCGAGDAFHGAFLWAYLQEWDPVRSADWAQAAVAVRITRLGNRAGLPSRADIEAFLASSPPRAGVDSETPPRL